jgi:hypothetical protein
MELQERDAGNGIITAGCDALTQLRDPRAREPLRELLLRDNGWFFERTHLAEAYLSLAGDRGGRVLLDAVRSDDVTDFQKIPLMCAVAESCGKGHGWAHRDVLLAVAADARAAWQLRWLALEGLDHFPGDMADLEAPLGSDDARVAVAAAATSAAWGTPQRLESVRAVIVDGTLTASLTYERGLMAWTWPGRIATRLGRALSPYGGIDVTETFFDRGSTPPYSLPSTDEGEQARQWLYAFAPEAGVDAYLMATSDGNTAAVNHLPSRIPVSRVHAVLHHLTESLAVGAPDYMHRSLLQQAASAADDAGAVSQLLSLVRGSDVYIRADAHDAAYTVSRRARVRVLRDHTIVPLS